MTTKKKQCKAKAIINNIVQYVKWTVPQLSIMIIYNSTWSVLIQ